MNSHATSRLNVERQEERTTLLQLARESFEGRKVCDSLCCILAIRRRVRFLVPWHFFLFEVLVRYTTTELPPLSTEYGHAYHQLDDAVRGSGLSDIMPPDAATLPSPPDFAPWSNGNRPRGVGGGARGGMYPGGPPQQSRPGSYPNGNGSSPAGGRLPRFPNIKDLQDQAAALDVTEGTPVSCVEREGEGTGCSRC